MIITLTGTNSFGLQQTLRDLIGQFITEQGDMGLERLDGAEVPIERLGEALTSLPFLTTRKMVVLRQPSANKQFSERAEGLFNELPDTTDVIIVEPKLDKRSSYYKFIKKMTDYHEFPELDQNGLARWLVQTTKDQRGTLNQGDANYLVSRVGQNQQLLSNELEKLLLYNANITRQTIDMLTEATPQSTVFELLEAAFAGNAKRALALYSEQRALKVEPQQIIAMLTWQLHILALIKTAGQKSPEAIASEAKVSPYVVKKSLNITRHLTLARLKLLITDLIEIDSRIKREAFSADEALQHYFLKLSQ